MKYNGIFALYKHGKHFRRHLASSTMNEMKSSFLPETLIFPRPIDLDASIFVIQCLRGKVQLSKQWEQNLDSANRIQSGMNRMRDHSLNIL